MATRNITKKAAAIAALDAKSLPASTLAKRLNVSRATLYNWKAEAESSPELGQAVELEKSALAGRFFTLASGLADQLINTMDSATYDNRAVNVLATAVDKWLALTGQAQTITETRVRGSVSIKAEAAQALQLYVNEGFTVEESRALLQEDDPELYRALLAE